MSLVTMKSHKSGIRLLLDPEAPFSDVVHEIAKKCVDGRQFLGSQSVVLSLEGRDLTEVEENEILDAIRTNCDLNVVCLVGHDEETDARFLRALTQIERRLSSEESCRFYRGSLRNRESLDVEESIVILGDVNPNCSVSSKGSIIILGGLYGEAYAGGATDENAFVAALELNPELIVIGGVIYEPSERPKLLIKSKVQPKIAYVREGAIEREPLTRQALEKLYGF